MVRHENMKRRIILIAVLTIVAWFALSWLFMWPPICWPERTTSYKTACLYNLRCIDAAKEQQWAIANRKTDWSGICVNNLRFIAAAKEQWALANHKTNGDDVAVLGVNEYLKNRTTPVCPDGGSYIYNRMGEYPTCTLDGQMVPARPAKIRTSLFTWRRTLCNLEPHWHCGNLKGSIAEQDAAPVPSAPAGPSDGAR